MRIPLLRNALIGLIALFAVGLQSANADNGSITLTIYKGGWIIGASGGSGTLTFRGRSYRLAVGGIDYGLVFGGSKTVLRGRVRNIQRCRCLRCGWRGGCGWPWRPRDCPHQPEGRHSGAIGTTDRTDGERRSERVSDHDGIGRHVRFWHLADIDAPPSNVCFRG
jgi:hypothetical protein